jgi:demethylspheroidene O-methyltransferase
VVPRKVVDRAGEIPAFAALRAAAGGGREGANGTRGRRFFGSIFSTKEAVLSWRDRLLGAPGFHAFAARFWLTRGIARREARALFDVCAGFVYAQTLAACVELEVFDVLAAGPMEVPVFAARVGMSAAAARTLLDAAVSLRLVAPAGEGYRLGALGAALRGNPGVSAMVRHHRLFYADLADPVALLRGETEPALAKFWPYHGTGGDFAGYSTLMAATQPMIAAEILAAFDVSRTKHVLDVCGGDGAFLCAVGARATGARLVLFDLAPVAARAAARFAAAGLADRAMAVGGDVGVDALPAGADLVTLVRVLHDNDDARALGILKKARAALADGGRILVAEPLAGTGGAERVGAYFGFYLAAMRNGRPRTAAELRGLMEAAGFARVRRIRTNQPMLTSVLSGEV